MDEEDVKLIIIDVLLSDRVIRSYSDLCALHSFRKCLLRERSSKPASSTTNVPAQTNVRKRGFHNPICCKCNKRHQGVCRYGTHRCFGCGRQGHYLRDCPQVKQDNKDFLHPICSRCGKRHAGVCRIGSDVCYNCGLQDHVQRECPSVKYNSNTKSGGAIHSPRPGIANSTTPFAARSTRTLADQGTDRDGVLGLSGDQARYHDMIDRQDSNEPSHVS
ncbi:uncharacterized protein LOC132048897 [Lycium ferocissimum]|uniref:uncharacterized protein LOC132048897 n=1 Tax=Lycium ferocissimum TaxID=112874 RepID=UPI002815BD2F|nr:uncharacterized protein LOC132048897 [Lycium ferocissimum]